VAPIDNVGIVGVTIGANLRAARGQTNCHSTTTDNISFLAVKSLGNVETNVCQRREADGFL
jgi:hypothetical protein